LDILGKKGYKIESGTFKAIVHKSSFSQHYIEFSDRDFRVGEGEFNVDGYRLTE